jgi:hypothetical protein
VESKQVLTVQGASRLPLEGALEAEAGRLSGFLPPVPGLAAVAEHASEPFCSWLRGQLVAGFTAQPSVPVNVRKPTHATRPVHVAGIPERVVYNALTEALLSELDPPDRGAHAYAEFIKAPLQYLLEKSASSAPEILVVAINQLLEDPELQYVVTSDIAAFYQYIDHGILSTELMRHSADFEMISTLIALLQRMVGREFGIPQQSRPSDRLSELIGELLSSSLLRSGYPTWRFNDDFRIGARSFADALAAIEVLDEAARELGLVVNEHKTRILLIKTYLTDTLGLDVDEPIGQIDESDEIEDLVADYDEWIFSADEAGDALSAFMRLTASPAEGISRQDVGRTRRSLVYLSRESNPMAVRSAAVLVGFAPSLTPSVAKYLATIDPSDDSDPLAMVAHILASDSLSEWQRSWFAHVAGSASGGHGDRSELSSTTASLARTARTPYLRAVSTLAAVRLGSLAVTDMEHLAIAEPSPLAPWYLTAVYESARSGNTLATRVLDGLMRASELFELLVQSYDAAPSSAST